MNDLTDAAFLRRGMLNCGEQMLFSFSGTIKRVKMRMQAAVE